MFDANETANNIKVSAVVDDDDEDEHCVAQLPGSDCEMEFDEDQEANCLEHLSPVWAQLFHPFELPLSVCPRQVPRVAPSSLCDLGTLQCPSCPA